MFNVKQIVVGAFALSLLGVPTAPSPAAAQAGTKTYEITVTNITNSKQGLSPLVIASHPANVQGWQMGQPASKGLELLAEEGMPDQLAAEWKGVATDVAMTHAHLLPGDSIVVHLTAHDGDVLSAASMLIETNDGFTGLNGAALTGTQDTVAYDAGTEDNSEKATDVPGPPFGGKNHGPDSSPHQAVAMHPGISGKADVTADFAWTGPVARFSVREIDPASMNPPAGMKLYDVTVTNITNSMQGLSPLAIASHPANVRGWQMGQPASKGLELLAEEGMPDQLASEWKGVATDVVMTHAHLLPGDSITVRIMAKDGDVLSAASMLIQTNDGFTGLHGMALSGTQDTVAYDAGTEDNSERATDVPGPPFGGKNSGPDSAPHQPVAMHPGISGKADVKSDFQWSGPVARFNVQALNMTGTMPGTTMPGTAMPGMPNTGTPDSAPWLLAALAGALALLGLTLRRAVAVHR